VEAQERGVNVNIVLDKSQRTGHGSLYKYMQENEVPTRINSNYAIMHNKFMIIDGKILELGSFNYTKSAEEKNAENVLVLRNKPKVIKDYSKQWKKLWDEAQ
jgi:phosphatidylserine/phosphatidylglycerophosphate/cardiolipin synthase-like enzyme